MGIHQFLAAVSQAPVGIIAMSPWGVYDYEFDPATASASFSLDSNGTVAGVGTSVVAGSPNWYLPTTVGIGASYWVRLTVTSGDAPTSGNVGVWTSLASVQSWTLAKSIGIGTDEGVYLIEIASDAAGTTIVSTNPGFVLSASREV